MVVITWNYILHHTIICHDSLVLHMSQSKRFSLGLSDAYLMFISGSPVTRDWTSGRNGTVLEVCTCNLNSLWVRSMTCEVTSHLWSGNIPSTQGHIFMKPIIGWALDACHIGSWNLKTTNSKWWRYKFGRGHRSTRRTWLKVHLIILLTCAIIISTAWPRKP